MDAETAAYVDKAGADLIGFVFAKSRRRVTAEEALAMKSVVKKAQTVGVFVDPTREALDRISDVVDLDYVQLHGNESIEFIQSLNKKVIKALSIQSEKDLEKVVRYAPYCAYLLIDGPKPGSGESFDWSLLQDIPKHIRYFLAGGLTASDLERVKKEIKPFGVDVSSGVEKAGIKDSTLIQQFITEAKG